MRHSVINTAGGNDDPANAGTDDAADEAEAGAEAEADDEDDEE